MQHTGYDKTRISLDRGQFFLNDAIKSKVPVE